MSSHIEYLEICANVVLRKMVAEIIEWQNTGILSDGEFRKYVNEYCKLLDKHFSSALAIGESSLKTEVYKRFVKEN